MRIIEVQVAMVFIHLEAVEQAPCVYCYHARFKDVTLADVSHLVAQVSGAADQVGSNHFLEQK